MVNKQTSISQRLFTDLKHARVQLHGGFDQFENFSCFF